MARTSNCYGAPTLADICVAINERTNETNNKYMKKTIQQLNDAIDKLIIKGKTGTAEYKRLCRLHKRLTQ